MTNYKSYEALRYIQEEIDAGRSYSKEGLISFLKSKISKLENSYANKKKEIAMWIVECQNPLVSEGRKYVWEQQRIVDERDTLARIKKRLDKLNENLRQAS